MSRFDFDAMTIEQFEGCDSVEKLLELLSLFEMDDVCGELSRRGCCFPFFRMETVSRDDRVVAAVFYDESFNIVPINERLVQSAAPLEADDESLSFTLVFADNALPSPLYSDDGPCTAVLTIYPNRSVPTPEYRNTVIEEVGLNALFFGCKDFGSLSRFLEYFNAAAGCFCLDRDAIGVIDADSHLTEFPERIKSIEAGNGALRIEADGTYTFLEGYIKSVTAEENNYNEHYRLTVRLQDDTCVSLELFLDLPLPYGNEDDDPDDCDDLGGLVDMEEIEQALADKDFLRRIGVLSDDEDEDEDDELDDDSFDRLWDEMFGEDGDEDDEDEDEEFYSFHQMLDEMFDEEVEDDFEDDDDEGFEDDEDEDDDDFIVPFAHGTRHGRWPFFDEDELDQELLRLQEEMSVLTDILTCACDDLEVLLHILFAKDDKQAVLTRGGTSLLFRITTDSTPDKEKISCGILHDDEGNVIPLTERLVRSVNTLHSSEDGRSFEVVFAADVFPVEESSEGGECTTTLTVLEDDALPPSPAENAAPRNLGMQALFRRTADFDSLMLFMDGYAAVRRIRTIKGGDVPPGLLSLSIDGEETSRAIDCISIENGTIKLSAEEGDTLFTADGIRRVTAHTDGGGMYLFTILTADGENLRLALPVL